MHLENERSCVGEREKCENKWKQIKAAKTGNETWRRETKRSDSLSWLSSISPATATAASLMLSWTCQPLCNKHQRKKSHWLVFQICNSTIEERLMATHTPSPAARCVWMQSAKHGSTRTYLELSLLGKRVHCIHMISDRTNLTKTQGAALICVFKHKLLMWIPVTNIPV